MTQKSYFSVWIFVFLIVLSVFPHVSSTYGLQVYAGTEIVVGFDLQKLINDGLPK